MSDDAPPLVLLVDDDAAFLGSMGKGLRMEGFRVLTAASGEEAIHLIQELRDPIDAVVMDIFLPDTWGSSLAFTLQQSQPGTHIIYVSGYAETDPMLREFRETDVVLLSKPFELSELVGELRRRLG